MSRDGVMEGREMTTNYYRVRETGETLFFDGADPELEKAALEHAVALAVGRGGSVRHGDVRIFRKTVLSMKVGIYEIGQTPPVVIDGVRS